MLRLAWGVSVFAMGALLIGCGNGAVRPEEGSPDLLVGGGDAALVDGPAPDLLPEWSAPASCAGNADCNKLGGGTLCCSSFCVNPASDVKNCGGCGQPCPVVRNGMPGCASGSCLIAACNPGFEDCDKDPRNGCEQDLRSDDNHCSGCNLACARGTHCSGGTCR